MKAHLTFKNVGFDQNDTNDVDVKLGEVFTMKLVDVAEQLQWTTSKDPVLDVSEKDPITVEITALKVGTSRVLLLNSADTAVFRLNFNVYDPEEAAKFDVPDPVTEKA